MSRNHKVAVSLLMIFGGSLAKADFNYEGYLTDSAGHEIVSQSMQLSLQILNPSGTCQLFEESQTVMTGQDGYFSVTVGLGAPSGSNLFSLNRVFQNFGTMSPSSPTSCSYSPVAGDARRLNVSVSADAGVTWDNLGYLSLNPTPMASSADTIAGLVPASLMRVQDGGVNGNVAAFTTSQFNQLLGLSNGSTGVYMVANNSLGAPLPAMVTAPGSAVAGSLWYNTASNSVMYFNGTTSVALGVAGAGLSSVTLSSNLTGNGSVGVTMSAPGTIDLSNTGVGPGFYSRVNVDSKGRVTSGGTLGLGDIPSLPASQITTGVFSIGQIPGLDASQITAGTLNVARLFAGPTNAANSLVMRDGGGNFSAGAIDSSLLTLRGSTVGNMTMAVPSAFSNYSLVWPNTDGSSGQLLTTDGAGNLSWSFITPSQWVSSINNIYFATGSVGVGTTLPSARFHVEGSAGPSIVLNSSDSTQVKLDLKVGGTSRAALSATSSESALDSPGNIYFRSGGFANQLVLTPSGNIGVGTNSPGQKLSVTGTIESTTGGFRFPDGTTQTTTAGAQPWTVSGSNVYRTGGSVGINTSTPMQALDVNGSLRLSSQYPALNIDGTGGAWGGQNWSIAGNAGGGSTEHAQYLRIGNSTYADVFVINATGETLIGYNTIYDMPKSKLDVAGGVGVGSYAGVTAAPANGMIVSGTVGIGTSSPSSRLHIKSPTGAVSALSVDTTDSSGVGAITRVNLNVAGTTTWSFATDSSQYLKISNNAGTVQMSATQSGNFGIGTMSPVVALDLSAKTDSVRVPAGSTGQRPGSPSNGDLRFNTTDNKFEVYEAGSWRFITQHLKGVQVFTSSGTFAVPAGVTTVKVTAAGGGGGGNSTLGGGPGGAGFAYVNGLTPGASIAVTVGAGGAYSSPNAGDGTVSSFGSFVTANPGTGASGVVPGSPGSFSSTETYAVAPGAAAMYGPSIGFGGSMGSGGGAGIIVVEW